MKKLAIVYLISFISLSALADGPSCSLFKIELKTFNKEAIEVYIQLNGYALDPDSLTNTEYFKNRLVAYYNLQAVDSKSQYLYYWEENLEVILANPWRRGSKMLTNQLIGDYHPVFTHEIEKIKHLETLVCSASSEILNLYYTEDLEWINDSTQHQFAIDGDMCFYCFYVFDDNLNLAQYKSRWRKIIEEGSPDGSEFLEELRKLKGKRFVIWRTCSC